MGLWSRVQQALWTGAVVKDYGVLSDGSIGRQHRTLFSAWCSVPALPKSAQSAAIPLYSRHEWYGGGPGHASTRTAGRCLWTGGIGLESGFGARFRGGD